MKIKLTKTVQQAGQTLTYVAEVDCPDMDLRGVGFPSEAAANEARKRQMETAAERISVFFKAIP